MHHQSPNENVHTNTAACTGLTRRLNLVEFVVTSDAIGERNADVIVTEPSK